jgi:hypothetical protein
LGDPATFHRPGHHHGVRTPDQAQSSRIRTTALLRQSPLAVRDSKDATGSALTVTHQAWDMFVAEIKRGQFSL